MRSDISRQAKLHRSVIGGRLPAGWSLPRLASAAANDRDALAGAGRQRPCSPSLSLRKSHGDGSIRLRSLSPEASAMSWPLCVCPGWPTQCHGPSRAQAPARWHGCREPRSRPSNFSPKYHFFFSFSPVILLWRITYTAGRWYSSNPDLQVDELLPSSIFFFFRKFRKRCLVGKKNATRQAAKLQVRNKYFTKIKSIKRKHYTMIPE